MTGCPEKTNVARSATMAMPSVGAPKRRSSCSLSTVIAKLSHRAPDCATTLRLALALRSAYLRAHGVAQCWRPSLDREVTSEWFPSMAHAWSSRRRRSSSMMVCAHAEGTEKPIVEGKGRWRASPEHDLDRGCAGASAW